MHKISRARSFVLYIIPVMIIIMFVILLVALLALVSMTALDPELAEILNNIKITL